MKEILGASGRSAFHPFPPFNLYADTGKQTLRFRSFGRSPRMADMCANQNGGPSSIADKPVGGGQSENPTVQFQPKADGQGPTLSVQHEVTQCNV